MRDVLYDRLYALLKTCKTIRFNEHTRIIRITGMLDFTSSLTFLACLELLELNDQTAPITLLLDSCSGGFWIPIKQMHANIRALRMPVFAEAKNYVRSGGLLLFAAANHRSAWRGTELYFHSSHGTKKGLPDEEMLTANYYEFLSAIGHATDQYFFKSLADGFGLEDATWRVLKWCEERRSWILDGKEAKEALALGIVDTIIDKKKRRKRNKRK